MVMREKYAPTTEDAALVTCKRCLKIIAERAARAAAKAAQS